MLRWLGIATVLLVLGLVPSRWSRPQLRIGSKKFTESVILGEMLTQLAQVEGRETVHFRELGGTKLVFDALAAGDIDTYADYTGTIREQIFFQRGVRDDDEMRALLAEQGIAVSRPLGFNNSYALAMLPEAADRREVETISDLTRFPSLRFGFTNEFMHREDGWPGLRARYDLPQRDVQGLDHDIAYRQLAAGDIDVMDVYTTDAKIEELGLTLLSDNREFFPRYDAVVLYRAELAERVPDFVARLEQLEGRISEREITTLNARVELGGESEGAVAADFLKAEFGVEPYVYEPTTAERIVRHTLEHLDLVRRSLLPAIVIAVPLGIVAAKRARIGELILAGAGIVQTIPALALLVLLMAPVNVLGGSSVGRGSTTAVLALFLYSLLPIVRNTCTGLRDIPRHHLESAAALGLPALARLRLVEMPLASRTILAGIKTAAVINVGFATLGALIGAGGYGQPILTGIRLNSTGLIMQGAIPAALLALAAQGAFEVCERLVVPRGLRLKADP